MMKNWILSTCLLLHASSWAVDIADSSQNAGDALIGQHEDVVYLKDGKTIKGTLSSLPPATFDFGALSLKINDVSAITLTKKMEVVTREGFVFICDTPTASLDFEDLQQINLSQVSSILFKERFGDLIPKPDRWYQLTFSNGDQIPVILDEDQIELFDEDHDYIIKTEDILSLKYDGKIQGKARDFRGEERQIQNASLKEKHLRIQVIKTGQILGIPWDSIASITLSSEKPIEEPIEGPFAIAEVVGKKSSLSQLAFLEAPKRGSHDLEKAKKVIVLFKKQNADLKKEITLMTERIELYQNRMQELQDLARDKSEEIAALHAAKNETHTHLVEQIQQLTAEKEGQQVYQEELEDMINRLMLSVEEEKKISNELEDELLITTQQVEASEKKIADLHDKLNTKWEEIEELTTFQKELQNTFTEKLTDIQSEKDLTTQEKQELQEQISSLKQILEGQQKEIEVLTILHDQKEIAYLDKMETSAKEKEVQTQLTTQHCIHSLELEDMLGTLLGKIETMQLEQTSLQQILTRRQEELKILEEQYNTQMQLASQYNIHSLELEEMVGSLLQKIEKAEYEHAILHQALEEGHSDIRLLEEQYQVQKHQNIYSLHLEDIIASLLRKIDQTENDYDTLQETLESSDTNIRWFDEQLKTQKRLASQLNIYSLELEGILGSQLQKNDRIQDEYALLQKALESRDFAIRSLEENYEAQKSLASQLSIYSLELEGMLGSQLQINDRIQNEYALLQKALESREFDIRSLEEEYENQKHLASQLNIYSLELEEMLETHLKKIDHMENAYALLQKNLESRESTLQLLEEEYEKQKLLTDQYQVQSLELKEMIGALLNKIHRETERSLKSDRALKEMAEKTNVVEQQYLALQKALESRTKHERFHSLEMMEMVGGLLNQIDSIDEEHIALKQTLIAREVEIDTLKGQYYTQNEQISEHAMRSQELEELISSLLMSLETEQTRTREHELAFHQLEQEFSKKQEEIDNLTQSKIALATTHNEKMEFLSAENHSLIEECKILNNTLFEKEKESETVRASFGEIYEELLAQSKVLREELEKVTQTSAKELENFRAKEKNYLQEIDALKDVINAEHENSLTVQEEAKKREQLVNQFEENLQSTFEILAGKEQELAQLRQERQDKQRQFEGIQKEASDQIEILTQQIFELLAANEQKDLVTDEQNQKLLELQTLNQRIKEDHSVSTRTISQLETAIATLTEELQNERNQADLFKEGLSVSQNDFFETQNQLETLQVQLLDSQKVLVSKQNEVEFLTLAQEKLKAELLEENQYLEKILEGEFVKTESMNAHLTTLLPKYENEKSKRVELEDSIQVLNEKLTTAMQHLKESKLDQERSKKALSEILAMNKKLMKEKDLLAAQLKKEKDKMTSQAQHFRELAESLSSEKESLPATEYDYKDIHIVSEGENLNNISMKYYGTPYRWSDIYEANQDVIPNVNAIKVGTTLMIPH